MIEKKAEQKLVAQLEY